MLVNFIILSPLFSDSFYKTSDFLNNLKFFIFNLMPVSVRPVLSHSVLFGFFYANRRSSKTICLTATGYWCFSLQGDIVYIFKTELSFQKHWVISNQFASTFFVVISAKKLFFTKKKRFFNKSNNIFKGNIETRCLLLVFLASPELMKYTIF